MERGYLFLLYNWPEAERGNVAFKGPKLFVQNQDLNPVMTKLKANVFKPPWPISPYVLLFIVITCIDMVFKTLYMPCKLSMF